MTDITTHKASRKRLLIALAITSSFMVVQVIAAYYANSLAIFADAGHLFVHNSTLFIAILASSIAIHLAKNFNEGYHKAELYGGLINGVLYLAISSTILIIGGGRFEEMHHGEHHDINPQIMAVIAIVGFVFHGLAAWVLYQGRKDSVNVYAVFLHTFFDLLSTITTLIASAVIYFTGWQQADVVFSLLIAVFVFVTGLRLIVQCLERLRTPKAQLPAASEIEKQLMALAHVSGAHNVTVSQVDTDLVVGAHLVLKAKCTLEQHDQACRDEATKMLGSRYGVTRCVLQIEANQSVFNGQPHQCV